MSKIVWVIGYIALGIIIAIFAGPLFFQYISVIGLGFAGPQLIMIPALIGLFIFALAIPIHLFLHGKKHPLAESGSHILTALFWIAVPIVIIFLVFLLLAIKVFL